jgi:hypothetical protein
MHDLGDSIGHLALGNEAEPGQQGHQATRGIFLVQAPTARQIGFLQASLGDQVLADALVQRRPAEHGRRTFDHGHFGNSRHQDSLVSRV